MVANIKDDFISAMRQFAGAVCLITAQVGNDRRGLTATAITSVSADPPHILACINRLSGTNQVIIDSNAFAVNVLAASDISLAKTFSSDDSYKERFSHGNWVELVTGAPVLKTALAILDCRLVKIINIETHTVFIGQVIAAQCQPGNPLLYLNGIYHNMR